MRESLTSNGITLLSPQLEMVVSIYEDHGIPELCSADNRVEELFLDRKIVIVYVLCA